MSIADIMEAESQIKEMPSGINPVSLRTLLTDVREPLVRRRQVMPPGFELPPPGAVTKDSVTSYLWAIMVVMRRLAERNIKVLSSVRKPLLLKSGHNPGGREFFRSDIEIEYDVEARVPYKRRRWQTKAQAYRVQKRINSRSPVERTRFTMSLSDNQAKILLRAIKERK